MPIEITHLIISFNMCTINKRNTFRQMEQIITGHFMDKSTGEDKGDTP